jgi:beta-aspartyl-peptidase (threonine type)
VSVHAGTIATPLVAVSGTGLGEQYVRHSVAHDIAALVEYAKMPLAAAVSKARPGF